LRSASEVDGLAYAAWLYDNCPANCLALYRQKVEALLLVQRHRGLAAHASTVSAPDPGVRPQSDLGAMKGTHHGAGRHFGPFPP